MLKSRILIAVVSCCVLFFPSVGRSQNLAPNGSFEDGQSAITDWLSRPGGSLGTNEPHRGKRYLSGRSARGEILWESSKIKIEPQRDYRLEGWLRVSEGAAVLRLHFHNGMDEGLGEVRAERPQGRPIWQYVAVEMNAKTATSATISFEVKGQADLDDVVLTPVAVSFFANKGMEPDQRNRIGFWGEEKSEVLPGRRAGKFRADPDIKREGKHSLQLTPTGDWYGYSSLNYPAAPWTDRVQLSIWARCDEKATGQILACWTDDSQKVLRVDAGPRAAGFNPAVPWQPLIFEPPSAPDNAHGIRLVAVARGGQVWFDEGDIVRLGPSKRVVRVFVNQVGYDSEGPKSAVVATNFYPSEKTTLAFQVLDHKGEVVWKNDISCSGRIHSGKPDDWGWYFWRADFSPFKQSGAFRAAAQIGETRVESVPFAVGRAVLLQETAKEAVDFFYVQRCGCDVPGWFKACHLDCAKLPDGTHIDATGGWHSAGDYNKLMYEHGDGGAVFAMMSLYGTAPETLDKLDRDKNGLPDIIEEAEWGADFVAKMQIPETGGLRNHIHQGPARTWMKWSAPDVHTDNKIGTRDDPVIQPGPGNSPLVIGGWARLSSLLAKRGIKSDYMDRARRLWDHDTKTPASLDSPYHLLSALELHRTTGEAGYLDYARRSAKKLLSSQVQSGNLQGAFGGYGQTHAAALGQFALSQPTEPLVPEIKDALRKYVRFCTGTADNAFGVSKQRVGEGEGFLPEGLGNNFEFLGRAWAAALCYRVLGDERALTYAVDHVDWVLGKNPLNLCMFEGKGTVNPPRYHHRYNMIPGRERGAVPGAIPNGVVRDLGLADRPGFDLSRTGGRSPSFRTSEPWLVHNVFYLLAVEAVQRHENK